MVSTLSLVREQSSEYVSTSIRLVKQDGVLSFLKAAANHTYDISIVLLFNTLFGSITRDEMSQRAKQSGRYWEYGSSEKIEIRNQDWETVPELFAECAGTYEVSRPFVCELDGGGIINGSDPLVLTRDRKVVMETEKPLFGPQSDTTQADTPFHRRTEFSDRTTSDRMRQLCRGYIRSRSPFHTRARFEAVFPLVRRDTSYYHWLLDQLPAIRGLRRYEEVTGRNPTVVVEPNPPDWVQETLSLVGVDTVVPIDEPVVKTDRLVVSSRREGTPGNQSVYEPSRTDISWLNREMKSRTPSTPTDYSDRIYISRENFTHRGRYVTNRKELEGVLEEFDIEICTPETLSVAEQIRLHENADLIVGPYGAGLTNMIFSKDACVVELRHNSYCGPTYQHLARLCGHDYEFLQCGGGSSHQSPMEIDTTELRELLTKHC